MIPEPGPSHGRALTDLGNAERLVDRFGHCIRCVHDWNCWLLWDGSRWRRDNNGGIERLAKHAIRLIHQEAAEMEDPGERAKLVAFAKASEASQRLKAMMSLARSEAAILADSAALDRDPLKLNVLNGTIDLRTGMLLPHSPEDMITRMAPVALDPGAEASCFEAFIGKIMGGDVELIEYLQRVIGYGLSGETTEQALFLLHGTGANGKSTLLELFRSILGDYACQADFTTFLRSRGDGPRNDIARLQGRRFVTAIEPCEGRGLSEGVIKQMTGGDTVTARFLYSELFEFRPVCKLFLAANHKPQVSSTDQGLWRRLHLIPFDVVIPVHDQQRGLLAQLQEEASGILNWAMNGCRKWQAEGLKPPARVLAASSDYRRDLDRLAPFLEERCECYPDYVESAAALYQAYRNFSVEAGEALMSNTEFGRSLSERGFLRVKHGTISRKGLRLSRQPGPADSSDSPRGEVRTDSHSHGTSLETVQTVH